MKKIKKLIKKSNNQHKNIQKEKIKWLHLSIVFLIYSTNLLTAYIKN